MDASNGVFGNAQKYYDIEVDQQKQILDFKRSKVLFFLDNNRPAQAKTEIEDLKDLTVRLNFLIDVAFIYLEKRDLERLHQVAILYQGEAQAHIFYQNLGKCCVQRNKPELLKLLFDKMDDAARSFFIKAYQDLAGESFPEKEVDDLLRQQKYQEAYQIAIEILNPSKRETAFVYLIRYNLEMQRPARAQQLLGEIKNLRSYDTYAAQICRSYIQIDDAANARAMCRRITESTIKQDMAGMIERQFGVDDETQLENISQLLKANQYKPAHNLMRLMKEGSSLRDGAATLLAHYCLDNFDVPAAMQNADLCTPLQRDKLVSKITLRLFENGYTEEAFQKATEIKDPVVQRETAAFFDIKLSSASDLNAHPAQSSPQNIDARINLAAGKILSGISSMQRSNQVEIVRPIPLRPIAKPSPLVPLTLKDEDLEIEVQEHLFNDRLVEARDSARKIKLPILQQRLLFEVFNASMAAKNIQLALIIAEEIKEESFQLSVNDRLAQAFANS